MFYDARTERSFLRLWRRAVKNQIKETRQGIQDQSEAIRALERDEAADAEALRETELRTAELARELQLDYDAVNAMSYTGPDVPRKTTNKGTENEDGSQRAAGAAGGSGRHRGRGAVNPRGRSSRQCCHCSSVRFP